MFRLPLLEICCHRLSLQKQILSAYLRWFLGWNESSSLFIHYVLFKKGNVLIYTKYQTFRLLKFYEVSPTKAFLPLLKRQGIKLQTLIFTVIYLALFLVLQHAGF